MSPPQQGNLFSLNGETSRDGWAHGKVFATGAYRLSADFHRGIDVDADARIDAGLSGDAEVLGAAQASLSASLQAEAGGGLTVAFPLDLFMGAGLLARLHAEVQASASFRAQVSLDMAEFRRRVREPLGPAAGEFFDILLEESDISAGVWGKASFAAALNAEVALVGHLIPVGDAGAGFTCALACDACVGFGAGIDFVANFGFKKPDRLLNRLADKLVTILENEIERRIDKLRNPDDARRAMAILKLILPLGARAAFSIAFQLATRPASEHNDAALSSLARGFVREGQELLLRALIDVAVAELRSVIGSQAVLKRVLQLADADLASLIVTFDDIRAGLWDLSQLEPSSIDDWFSAVLSMLDPLMRVVELPLLEADDSERWQENVALLWTAAALLRPVIQWVSQQVDDNTPAFDSAPIVAQVPNDPALREYVGARIGKDPRQLSLVDLVTFVITDPAIEGRLATILAQFPALEPVIDWLCQVAGADSSGLLEAFLKRFEGPGAKAADLLAALAEPLRRVVQDSIVPDLFDQLMQVSDDETQEFIQRVARPTVLSLLEVVVPGIAALDGTDRSARVFREQLSVVLLQMLSRLILVSSRVLLDHGMENARVALEGAADDLENGKRDDLLHRLSLAAAQSPLCLFFDAQTAADFLRLGAGTIDRWNAPRDAAFKKLEELVGLGLMTGDTALNEIWTGLRNQPDSVLLLQGVEDLIGHVTDGVLNVLGYVFYRARQILQDYFERVSAKLAAAIDAAVREAVQAAEATVQLLEQGIDELQAKAAALATDVETFFRDIAADIAALGDRAQGLIDDAIANVRARGWELVRSVLVGNWLFQHAPNADRIERAFHRLFDSIFDGLRYLLDLPLRTLSQVAGWVNEELTAQVTACVLDGASLRDNLRRRFWNSAAQPLSFSVEVVGISLGTITLPHSEVLGRIGGTVTGDGELNDRVDKLLRNAQPAASTQAQLIAVQDAIDGLVTQARAQQALDQLYTDQAIGITFVSPDDNSTYDDATELKITISGINQTFVQNVLGVPPRVSIFLNGTACEYSPFEWEQTAAGLSFSAMLVAGQVGLVPRPIRSGFHLARLRVPPGHTLSRTTTERGHTYELLPITTLRPTGRSPIPAAILTPQDFPIMNRPINRPIKGASSARLETRATSSSDVETELLIAERGREPLPTRREYAVGYQLALTALRTTGDDGDDPGTDDPSPGGAGTGDGPDLPDLRVIPLRNGLNTVLVVAADGKAARASASQTFYFRSSH